MTYTEGTIRRKAYNIGYQVQKGFQHFDQYVFHNSYGERYTGYMVMDLRTGFYEPELFTETSKLSQSPA